MNPGPLGLLTKKLVLERFIVFIMDALCCKMIWIAHEIWILCLSKLQNAVCWLVRQSGITPCVC